MVGARAELRVGRRALTRFAKGGGSYLSSGDRRLVFGLAEQTEPGRLTVTWAGGAKQHFDGLAVDRYYRIVQGQARAEPHPVKKWAGTGPVEPDALRRRGGVLIGLLHP